MLVACYLILNITVKSCYRWIQGDFSDGYSDMWKKLWSLKLPEKVTNFLWRLCKGCLPTNVALLAKHVNIETSCPWCHGEAETDVHVMFLCDFAKSVWQTTGAQYLIQCSTQETAYNSFTRVCQQYTKEQCVEIAMICWSLWNRRNNWIWKRANGSVFGVRNHASQMLVEWKEAQIKGKDRRTQEELGDRIWKPPDTGWVDG